MKKISFVFAAAAIFYAAAMPAFSAGIPMDEFSDGVVDVYDLVAARQKGVSAEKLEILKDFLLGCGDGGNYDNRDIEIDESCILEPKGTIHTGNGTFYGGGYEGGCAMLDPVSRDHWIVAMNLADYDNARLAGAYIQVTGELGTINMLVTDLLPEGEKGDLDLYTDAFPLIAPVEKGKVPVSWKIIPFEDAKNSPVQYKFKEGSTEYWCGVQVRNHLYPITRLEYLDENGDFVEIPRRQYNYFESDSMGAGPFTFRITDIYGQMIVDEGIPLSYDDTKIIDGHVQFVE